MACPKRSAVVSDLPEDPLVEILARIPARSLCRSKCVAKAWRDVIEDPFHRKKLPQTLQGFFSITRNTHTALHIGYVSLIARSAGRQIDPSLSFLTKLPGFDQGLTFLDSCNGLLVFEHIDKSLGYVVCNPTTEQWGAVPRSDPSPSPSLWMFTEPTHLVFDPAVSCHFHLVQFEEGLTSVDDDYDDDDYVKDKDYGNDVLVMQHVIASLNVYSSDSGQWVHIESGWDKHRCCHLLSLCAVLNGMLHFIISENHKVQIVAVDVQGAAQKFIPVPITTGKKRLPQCHYVAQSQGCLHYINKADDAQLSIWVLEDYDTQKWVLKHSVSFMLLLGILSHWPGHEDRKNDCSVVAMHPDGNVVFIIQDWNRELISYNMDHKLVSVISTLESGTSTMHVVPYVPCFLESPALTNKQ